MHLVRRFASVSLRFGIGRRIFRDMLTLGPQTETRFCFRRLIHYWRTGVYLSRGPTGSPGEMSATVFGRFAVINALFVTFQLPGKGKVDL